MARTIQEIQQEIIRIKESEPHLSELNSTSKTAIWRLWVYITAFIIHTLELIFDTHKAEITEALKQQKPHTARWYRNKALAFQYGFDLQPESDLFNNEGKTEDEISNSKVVKYSAVTESEVESRLIIKIATEKAGELTPISSEQKTAFDTYINEIKDAGVRVTTINYLPDVLKLRMRIYYDPLVLDKNGQSILTAEKPVEKAIKEYLKNLPFDGELVLVHLVDALQKVEGVKIPHLISAESKWIDTGVSGYGDFRTIEIKKIPESGYFQMENFNNIEYIAG